MYDYMVLMRQDDESQWYEISAAMDLETAKEIAKTELRKHPAETAQAAVAVVQTCYKKQLQSTPIPLEEFKL